MVNTLDKSKIKSNPPLYYRSLFEAVNDNDLQTNYTPFEVVKEMCSKLEIVSNDQILVLYNVEFATFLVSEMKVKQSQITIYNNSKTKSQLLKMAGYNVIYQEVFDKNKNITDMKFDVVIGNPPYSEDAGANKASKIWIDFVEKSISLTKSKDSIVALVTPTNFLLPHHKSFKLINNFTKDIHIKIDVNNDFKGIKESIGYFILNINDNSVVDSNNQILDVQYGQMIPITRRDKLSVNLISKIFNNRKPLKISKGKSLNIVESGINNVFTNWDNRFTNNEHSTLNPRIYFSRVLRRYGKQRTLVVHADITGKSHIQDGYIIDLYNVNLEQLNNLYWILSESKLFRFATDAFGKSQYVNPSFAKNLPIIDLDINTNQDLYKYFNLTQEEIDYIENAVK